MVSVVRACARGDLAVEGRWKSWAARVAPLLAGGCGGEPPTASVQVKTRVETGYNGPRSGHSKKIAAPQVVGSNTFLLW